MRRLYYGRLLRQIRYFPPDVTRTETGEYSVHLDACDPHARRIAFFKNTTLDGLLADIKAAGYPVWGSDVLDYVSEYEWSAWDKLVIEEIIQLRELVSKQEREP